MTAHTYRLQPCVCKARHQKCAILRGRPSYVKVASFSGTFSFGSFPPNDASKAKGLFRRWECVTRLENIKKGQSRRKGMIVVVGGKHRLFERRCRGAASFFPFFFLLFPLVCVTDNSRSSSNLVEAREGESAGQPLDSGAVSHCTWNAITAGFTGCYTRLCAAWLEISTSRVQRAQCRGQRAVRSDWDTTTALLCRSPGPKSHWHWTSE